MDESGGLAGHDLWPPCFSKRALAAARSCGAADVGPGIFISSITPPASQSVSDWTRYWGCPPLNGLTFGVA